MNVFIDESGSFVNADRPGRWNCVVAYVSPEADRRKLLHALRRLKKKYLSRLRKGELKLREVREPDYFEFLAALANLNGVLFSVAVDAGIETGEAIAKHQLIQAEKIVEHKDKMRYEAARLGLEEFSEQIRNIAPQLYLQLFCHIYVIHGILKRGILYFVQRYPKLIGKFRWRVDQKNTDMNVFEDSYLKLSLPILQSISLRDPAIHLKEGDYSAFDRYSFPQGKEPTYLADDYGINMCSGFDLGKFLREDFRFEDSINNHGVQVADLIAAGIRRCLRLGFRDNQTAAVLLGSLMVQDRGEKPPLQLVTLGEAQTFVDDDAADAIDIMKRSCRPLLSA